MIFRTMALEEPHIRILNYAPGPLDTDMQLVARTKTGDKELKNLFDSELFFLLLQLNFSIFITVSTNKQFRRLDNSFSHYHKTFFYH